MAGARFILFPHFTPEGKPFLGILKGQTLFILPISGYAETLNCSVHIFLMSFLGSFSKEAFSLEILFIWELLNGIIIFIDL